MPSLPSKPDKADKSGASEKSADAGLAKRVSALEKRLDNFEQRVANAVGISVSE